MHQGCRNSHTIAGRVNKHSIVENSMENPPKLQINLPHDPSDPLLSIDSKEMRTLHQRNTCLCLLLEHSQKHELGINQCVHSQKTEQRRHGGLNAKWNAVQPPCHVWPRDGKRWHRVCAEIRQVEAQMPHISSRPWDTKHTGHMQDESWLEIIRDYPGASLSWMRWEWNGAAQCS